MVVADADRNLARMPARQIEKGVFPFRIAAAQEHELHVSLQNVFQCGQQVIDPLLIDQPGDVPKHRRLRFNRQIQFVLQRLFVARLVIGMFGVERETDERIVGGIPLRVIDAVQDATQNILALPQQAIHAATEFRRANLARIALAHRGQFIRVNNARFDARPAAKILDALRLIIIPGQVGQRIRFPGEHALIGEVVNREASARRSPPPSPNRFVEDEQRHQSGLPVVRVDDLRAPGQVSRELRHRLGKKDKARGIVGVIFPALAIKPGAVEKLRLVNEVDREIGLRRQLVDICVNELIAQRQIHHPIDFSQRIKPLVNPFVERRDDPHLMSVGGQCLGHGAHHVRKAARFGVGMNFAAGEQDSHGLIFENRVRPECDPLSNTVATAQEC